MCHDDVIRRRDVARLCFQWPWRVLVGAVVVAAMGSPSAAIERRPLPAFQVTAVGGAEINSARIVQTGHWLLLYVRADCRPCNDLLRLVEDGKNERQALATRMVIVVGGADASRLGAFKSLFPELSPASWFGDPGYRLPAVVAVRGAPVVIGLSDRTLVWSRAGMLKTSAETLAMLQSWVNKP